MKVQLLTNIRGAEKWVKGQILESPLHPDIQSLLNKPGVLYVFPETVSKLIPIPEVKVVEKKEEKKELPKTLPIDKPIPKEVELLKGKRAFLLRKGKSKK
jgi:hypothetical protein